MINAAVLALLAFATAPVAAPEGLRENVEFDARKLYVDDATYVALDWPNSVFPHSREVGFDGATNNRSPMWRMHFRSAPGRSYVVDCKMYIRNDIGSDAPKRVQVRAWQRKDGSTKDNRLVDAWMKLDDGHLRFMLEPNGDRNVKIWLESRKAWYWTVHSCEIDPRDND